MAGRTAIGWPVLEPGELTRCVVPVQGGEVVLHVRPGDTCDILMDFVRRYDATVEPLVGDWTPDFWTYAKRRVRESSDIWSEHSGGTALDCRSTAHPRGVRGTFTAKQRAAIEALLDFYDGVIAWGGHFKTTVDEMHFEVTVPPHDPLIAETARKVREALEDDMPTAKEIADAVIYELIHRQYTGDEAGAQLDKRSIAGVSLVGARASFVAVDLLKRLGDQVGLVAAQVNALAQSTADDATKAQVGALGDQVDALGTEIGGQLEELLTAVQQDAVATSTP